MSNMRFGIIYELKFNVSGFLLIHHIERHTKKEHVNVILKEMIEYHTKGGQMNVILKWNS